MGNNARERDRPRDDGWMASSVGGYLFTELYISYSENRRLNGDRGLLKK